MRSVCSMKNCKNSRDVCPISKLCPSCDAWMKDFNKRSDNHERQQHARDQVHAQHRNMDMSDPSLRAPTPPNPGQVRNTRPETSGPPAFNSANFPPVGGASSAPPPPAIDINGLFTSYNDMRSNSNQPPILMDMFALMLNIHSKQAENDELRTDIKSNTSRIDSIEAKIGGSDEVSEKLGLAVQFLPLPPTGYTDLDTVQLLFGAIAAPGIDVRRDIIKCVRKLPAKPGPNTPQPVLGSVMVEMRNEETKGLIMKNKYRLDQNQNEVYRNVRIRNMKSKEQMFMENLGNSILKKIPGCEQSYVTPSGQIRESTPRPAFQGHHPSQQSQSFQRPPPSHHRAPQPQLWQQRPQGVEHQAQQVRPPQPRQPYQQPQQPAFQPQQPPQFQFNTPTGYHPFYQNLFHPTNTQSLPTTTTRPAQVTTSMAMQSHPAVPTPSPNQVQDPYQSLLLQLDPYQSQQSTPAPGGPNLTLLQPADPHYENTEQQGQEQYSEE